MPESIERASRSPLTALPADSPRVRVARQLLGITLGAFVVALSAQVTVLLPFTPVPMTLQPLAVLAVGGILGARGGLAALVAYLAMGIAGLPVFAAGGSGIARLLGPTGGYLLAFPIAAAVTGALARPRPWRALLGCAAGMLVIHVGGVAQLAVLGVDPARALQSGFFPFFTADLLKVGLAATAVLLWPRPRRAPR